MRPYFQTSPKRWQKKWFECGAERLHLVDLDGAVSGQPVNRKTISQIVEAIPIPVELGGGVRDMATLRAYFDLGLQYVILGTVAHKNPDFVKEACRLYPGRIILGIDARNNRIAVEGWTEEINLTPETLAKRFENDGLAAIIYTDINRDGMRTGCNVEATGALARTTNIPVIASGGISEMDDVLKILPLAADGVMGFITGRALYDGSLDLAAAIKACQ
jgi:phosphoribosylformimino-5-aminoimidazole carboxamide ribotide isomerase